MSSINIKVENLGKQYRLGNIHGTLGNNLGGLFKKNKAELFWALKDISFEVKEGESLGIIGRNGAGKSTLLKILSHVTPPTIGNIKINGRVTALLEVGTGFHPELTGGENIYFNGAVLGMKRSEIKQVFNSIVEFAEIGDFINTPVKRYSSGMYTRLGFAVAAHLQPEILVVDEVLSVGDASFQKKCLGKIDDVMSSGRIVLFVSHNMTAVKAICPRVILLNHGQVEKDGKANEVIRYYLGEDSNKASQAAWVGNQRPGNNSFKINSIELKPYCDDSIGFISISKGGCVEIDFEVIENKTQAKFCLLFFDADGNSVFTSLSNTEPNYYGKSLAIGRYIVSCNIPGDLLSDGTFNVTIIGSGSLWADCCRLDNVLSFVAVDDGVLRQDYHGILLGALRPRLKWSMRAI